MRQDLTPWTGNDWSPFKLLREFEQELDRALSTGNGNARRQMAFQPAVDVEETPTHYLLSVDLPGIDKDQIKIDVHENRLSISGERKSERENKEGQGYFRERSYGFFSRSFTLPLRIDTEGIEANYENGVLEIVVPKATASGTRQVRVNTGKGKLFNRILGNRREEKAEKQENRDTKSESKTQVPVD